MNPRDYERLDVAYRAWHADRISDTEVEAGVRRVTRSMRGHRRTDPARRLASLGAAALALCAALAYGASSGGFGKRADPSTSDEAASPAPRYLSKGARAIARRADAANQAARSRSQADVAVEALSTDETRSDGDAGNTSQGANAAREGDPSSASRGRKAGAETAGREKGTGVRLRRAPKVADNTANSWREVGEALEAEDESRARSLLRDLATGAPDASTRAKAELGLAQLAVSRGECARATAIALSVARTPGIDEKLIKRAHDLVMRCERR